MIESWARGFNKITRYCEEENAKLPVIDLSLGGVTARCYASDVYLALMNEYENGDNVTNNGTETEKSEQKNEESGQKSGQKNEESGQKNEESGQKSGQKNKESGQKNKESGQKSRQKIILLISENPKITTFEMADKLDMSRSGITKQIAILQEQNLIRRVGPDKGGHWEIVQGEEK